MPPKTKAIENDIYSIPLRELFKWLSFIYYFYLYIKSYYIYIIEFII